MGKFGYWLFMGQMWVFPLEIVNCRYLLTQFLMDMPPFLPNKCILYKSTHSHFSRYMHTMIFRKCPQTFYDIKCSSHTPTLMLIKYKARKI
jgi:hypothetical protein